MDTNKYYLTQKATMRCVIDTASEKYSNTVALAKYSDNQSSITYKNLPLRIKAVSSFLLSSGFKKGDHVMVLGESCPNWVISYFAVTYCGMVAVTVLPNFPESEVRKIAVHSEAKFIFASSSNLEKTRACNLPVLSFEDLPKMNHINEEIDSITVNEDDLASIIYTSGTTGEPKGVMLTHRNLIFNADRCSRPFIHLKRGWNLLSILPLSHVYEFTEGMLLPLMCGCTITYLGRSPSVGSLLPALKALRPEVILSVPLLIEKIYSKAVVPQIEGSPKLKRLLNTPIIGSFVYRIIGRKLVSNLGGRLRFFGIGGAPLDKEVEGFLKKARFPYALGYGLTETSPLIAGCGPKSHKVGTIGKLLEGVEVRIDPNTQEIQTRSPSVMLGYYKNPSLTAECLTEDHWFKTGDTGAIKDGRLILSGRIKDMILTANGENIFPEAIESLINHQQFVQESLIIPNQGGLLALIKLDMTSFASNLKLDIKQAQNEASSYIQRLRQIVNAQLSSASRINDVRIQELPFERTPTMKLRRQAIIQRFQNDQRHMA